jgi:hypothetical protein
MSLRCCHAARWRGRRPAGRRWRSRETWGERGSERHAITRSIRRGPKPGLRRQGEAEPHGGEVEGQVHELRGGRQPVGRRSARERSDERLEKIGAVAAAAHDRGDPRARQRDEASASGPASVEGDPGTQQLYSGTPTPVPDQTTHASTPTHAKPSAGEPELRK